MHLLRHHATPFPPLQKLVLAACLLASASNSHAAENASNNRWVSDSLHTYVRSGETGGAVWIANRDLQGVPGQAERLPQLEQQVAELSAELAGINDTWKTRVQGMQETLNSRKTLIDELQTARSTLDSELSQTNSELRALQAQLGEENQQVLMRYMAYGAVSPALGCSRG